MSMNWGEKPKPRIVIQAENEHEAAILREFQSIAKREAGTVKFVLMGWIAAYVAAKEAGNADIE
jgi:hypothetical protein